jgi:hypothetical protein
MAGSVGKDLTQLFDGITIQYLVAVFGHKDQMNMEYKLTVSARSIVLLATHRPSIINAMKRLQAFILQ